MQCVDLGGRRIIKKGTENTDYDTEKPDDTPSLDTIHPTFFKQKTAYEM